VDFDPRAFGICLVRRRKKRSAGSAVSPLEATTTRSPIALATSTVLSTVSVSSSSFEGFYVGAVEP
jgi:hypothetical protein